MEVRLRASEIESWRAQTSTSKVRLSRAPSDFETSCGAGPRAGRTSAFHRDPYYRCRPGGHDHGGGRNGRLFNHRRPPRAPGGARQDLQLQRHVRALRERREDVVARHDRTLSRGVRAHDGTGGVKKGSITEHLKREHYADLTDKDADAVDKLIAAKEAKSDGKKRKLDDTSGVGGEADARRWPR